MLYGCTWVDDLAPFSTLPLQELVLSGAPVSDLTSLTTLHKLSYLSLQNCPNVRSLDPLHGHDALTRLGLGSTAVSDLRPLAGKKVTITLHEGQDVRGLEALGRRPRVVWMTPPAAD